MILRRRRKCQEERVLRALRDHPTEWFRAWEIARLAYVSAGGIYPLLYQLVQDGKVVDRWIERNDEGHRRRVYRIREVAS